MSIPLLDSVKIIERQYFTGEEPVLVICSDKNAYICKYMRSPFAAYKLACEQVGSQMVKAWHLNVPEAAFVRIKPSHWSKLSIGGVAFGSRKRISFLQLSRRKLLNFLNLNGLKVFGEILPSVFRKYWKMNSLRYSIIYAVIRPKISEQLSVGLIIVDNQGIEVRYSQKKLSPLQRNQSVNSVEAVNYLTRYSNNLIAVSPLQTIDIEPTEQIKSWLFRNYVYDRTQREGKRA